MANPLNLQEIEQEQALNLCRFYIKSQKSMFLLGRRGCGKTEIAMQAAKDCNMKINYINLSVVERPDLAGYPNIHKEEDIVTFKSPYFLPPLPANGKPDSVIIFDEVDKAPPEVTAPLLEILQFKKINGKPINAASCILTGNMFNEGAYSNMISSALLDRGAKYILNFNFDKWLDWAKVNNVHDLILGFLIREPDMACGAIETTHYASPSPRGWTLASEALHQAKKYAMTDLETITGIISGFVGAEAGLKFKMWYEFYKKFEPPILSLLETGDFSFDLGKLAPTELFIFCITLCYLGKRRIVETKNKAKQLQYAETICLFFNRNSIDQELQLISIRNSFPFEFITKYKLYENKVFYETSKQLTETAA